VCLGAEEDAALWDAFVRAHPESRFSHLWGLELAADFRKHDSGYPVFGRNFNGRLLSDFPVKLLTVPHLHGSSHFPSVFRIETKTFKPKGSTRQQPLAGQNLCAGRED
jgi:hypothetical protein